MACPQEMEDRFGFLPALFRLRFRLELFGQPLVRRIPGLGAGLADREPVSEIHFTPSNSRDFQLGVSFGF